MTPDAFTLALRNELGGLALNVHRAVHEASPTDRAGALAVLAEVERKVAAARASICDLPEPDDSSLCEWCRERRAGSHTSDVTCDEANARWSQ